MALTLMVKSNNVGSQFTVVKPPSGIVAILQNILKNYVQQKGLVDKRIPSPDTTGASAEVVFGEIYNYLTDGNNISKLIALQDSDLSVIDNLIDTILGKKQPPPTVNGQVAAWILVGDYSVFQATVTPGGFTTEYPDKESFIRAAKSTYDKIDSLYQKGNVASRDYNDLEYAKFPDEMDKYLSSENYAERIGALTFMLLEPVADSILPKPEAGYIGEGLVYVKKELAGKPESYVKAISGVDVSALPKVTLPASYKNPISKKNNTALYVGVGVAALAAIGVTVWAVRKK